MMRSSHPSHTDPPATAQEILRYQLAQQHATVLRRIWFTRSSKIPTAKEIVRFVELRNRMEVRTRALATKVDEGTITTFDEVFWTLNDVVDVFDAEWGETWLRLGSTRESSVNA